MPFPPLKFKSNQLHLLDQRKLPCKEVWITCKSAEAVHAAIRNMTVRGAPAIGIAGGYGLYLGMKSFLGSASEFNRRLNRIAEYLKSARPTGVNLRNIIDSIVFKTTHHHSNSLSVADLKKSLKVEAIKAHREDDRLCRQMGRHGQALIPQKAKVLTHCNAGGLATTGYGTALGVFYAAKEHGKKLHVYADETRPLLQGARLTAWELHKSGIPCTLLCDNMAASVMREKQIDCIIVGADRIAANGDTANKIGTYNLAVLAKAHGIPFYIAAPSTTFDFSIRSGNEIPIEVRESKEVTHGLGKEIAPKGIGVHNPAFDVTPHQWISAFITEAGVLRPPYVKSFKKLKKSCP